MSAALPLPELGETQLQLHTTRSRATEFVLYGCVSLLTFGPLAFGAVEPWANFVLEISATLLLYFWCFRQVKSGTISIAWSPIFVPMAAFGAVVALQLLPRMSAYRHETSTELLLYIAYAGVCFLLTQTLRRTTHVRRIGTALAIFGTSVAFLAVLQSLSSNDKLYWVRAPSFGGWIYGPYVNHNHYAGLMEMLVPVPLVFAFTKYAHGTKRWLAAFAAAFMGATIFLSGSRGGMAAFVVELAIFFWFLFRERTRSGVVLVLGAFLLMAVASVAWAGGSEVADRLSTLSPTKHSDVSAEIRIAIYRDSLHMFAKRPIAGWGLGTFPDAFPRFRSFYTNLFVNIGHNDYLQLLAETGLLGFLAGMWFLVAALRPAIRKLHNWPGDVNGAVALCALLGIAGILVHSLLDSNLQIPANAMLFYALCSVAAMEPRFRNHRREHRRRSVIEETPSEAQQI
jgi:O-antigen ligase